MNTITLCGIVMAALISVLISVGAGAAEPPRPGVLTLDTIVVTATKAPETFATGDVDLTRTPSFYTVIPRDAYEGRNTSLAQVLEKEAGIQVRQFGGVGSFSSVSLRGSTGEQVMLYLDGVLLNDASGGGVDLSTVSLADVASIEIYKGSAPIQFGRAGIGGVVNIKTLRAQDGFNGNVSAAYSSFNTRRTSALVNYKRSAWDLLLAGEYLKSDNDFKYLNTKGTLWTTADDEWERRANAWIEQVNLLTKAGLDLSGRTRLTLLNQWFDKDQGIPAWNNSPRNDVTLATRRNITTLRLAADEVTPLHLNTALALDSTWMEETYNDSMGQIGLGRRHTRNTTRKYGLNGMAEWLTSRNVLTATADLRHERYQPEDLFGRLIPHNSRRTLLNLGLENTLLLHPRLGLTPALRFTHIDSRLKSETTPAGARREARSDTQQHVSPQLGLKYQALEWLVLKGNLNRYVREPSFFELFGDRGVFTGNMDLKSEKGLNWDAGAEANWFFTRTPIERLALNVVYFHSRVDDLITRAFDARGIGRAVNISSSRIQGLEAGLRLDFMQYFSFTGHLTLQDTANRSRVGAFHDRKLPGRYATAGLARLEARHRGATVYIEYLADKDMYYDAANLLKAQDREEINLGATWLFRANWRITADVKNLQDKYYEDYYRYPMPGRSVGVGVGYVF